MDERHFAAFEFNMSFERISYADKAPSHAEALRDEIDLLQFKVTFYKIGFNRSNSKVN